MMKINNNVGSTDAVIRIGLGAGLLGMAILGWVGPWGWIGVVPLASGLLGSCPAYALFGLNTHSTERP